MKVVKKTSEYTIYQRRDNRYAVVNGKKKSINGDDKVKILTDEGLLKKAAPAPAPEPEEQKDAEDAGE